MVYTQVNVPENKCNGREKCSELGDVPVEVGIAGLWKLGRFR
jgi:hypothetical protein